MGNYLNDANNLFVTKINFYFFGENENEEKKNG